MAPIPFNPAVKPLASAGKPQPPTLVPADPRWTLAARAVVLASPHSGLASEQRERLKEGSARAGFVPIHAAAVLAIAEQAAQRGGLDATAAYQLALIPKPVAPTPRNHWPTLIGINTVLLIIAGTLLLMRMT